MANVSFLPAAEHDYQAALDLYQARSAQAAAGFEAAMEVALQRIASPMLPNYRPCATTGIGVISSAGILTASFTVWIRGMYWW